MIDKNQILEHMRKTHIGYKISVLDCVHSTNDFAKEMILAGVAGGSVVISRTQSAGRGRNGRTFASPQGGIYMSFIYDSSQIANKAQFLPFAPCIATCKAIEKYLGICAEIKWSNDIILNGKKVCGILTETQMNTSSEYVIVGIGVNYLTNPDDLPAEIKETAGTLRDYTHGKNGKTINEFISVLINELDELCVTPEPLLPQYKMRTNILGNSITVFTNGETIDAKAIDICEDGGLVIEKRIGKTEKIYAGDVTVRAQTQEIKLRPHHLLCTQGYAGKGYSADFVENMTAITDCLRNNEATAIRIVFSTDDICSKCPLMVSEDMCETNEKVKGYDSKVAHYFGIEEKSYVYQDVVREIKDKITPAMLDDICGNCAWYPVSECRRNILGS